MTNTKNTICRDFEHEMWLYLAAELPAERMEFWKKHLLECDDCTIELTEEIRITSKLKEKFSVDLDNSTFNRMIETAVSKRKSWIENIIGDRFVYAENKSFYGKAALIGAFATTAIIILLVTHQSIPVKEIPNNLLDWEGEKITYQIDDMKNRIQLIGEDKWGKEINLLDQRIEKLEKESDKFSFN